MVRVIWCLPLLLLSIKGISQHVRINEFFRPSNNKDGWIELANPLDSVISVDGFSLLFYDKSDEVDFLFIEESISLYPGSYKLVKVPARYYYNFDSLHYALLLNSASSLVDSLSFMNGLREEESLGRYPNMNGIFLYYAEASPEELNPDPGPWIKRANKTSFSPRDSSPNACIVFNDTVWVFAGWRNEGSEWFSKSDVYKSGDGISWELVNSDPPYNPYSGFVSFKNKMWAFDNTSFSSINGTKWDTVKCNVQFSSGAKFAVFNNTLWAIKGNSIWRSDNGIEWQVVTHAAPWIARTLPGLVVCQDKLWFFGGGIGYGSWGLDYYFNDVWYSNDGITWELATENASWPGRYWFASQSYNDMLFIFGGWNFYNLANANYGNSSDVWFSENGVEWKEWQGTPWAPRHAQFSFVFNNSLWLSSGYGTDGPSTLYNDVWQLDARMFFSKPSGDIADVQTWNTRMDGNGQPLVDFNDNNSIFFLVNRGHTVLTDSLKIKGNRSRLVITKDENLMVDQGYTLETFVALEENSTIEFRNESPQNFYFSHPTSTIAYDLADSDITIQPGSFPNLTLKNGQNISFEKDSIIVNGNLYFKNVKWEATISDTIFVKAKESIFIDSLSNILNDNISLSLIGNKKQSLVNESSLPFHLSYLNTRNDSDEILEFTGDIKVDSVFLEYGKIRLISCSLSFNKMVSAEKSSYFITDTVSHLRTILQPEEKLFSLGTENTYNPIYLAPRNLDDWSQDTIMVQLESTPLRSDTINVGWRIENLSEEKEVLAKFKWDVLNEGEGFSGTYLSIVEVSDNDTLYCVNTSKGAQEAERILYKDGFYTVINSCYKSTQTVNIADKLELIYGDSMRVPITSSANIPLYYDFMPDSLVTISMGTLLTKGAGNSFMTVHADSNEYFQEFTKVVPVMILKKTLYIVVKDTLLAYGMLINNVQFEIEYSGFINEDSVDNLRRAPELQLPTGYLEPGKYPLHLSNGYDDNYSIVIQSGTLIIDKPNDNFFNFSPNPAKDKINVRFDPASLPVKVSITNYLGQLVYEKICTQFHEVLYLPVLSEGLYLIQISNVNETTNTRRLLIVN